eukprot:symbB.v1.2.040775.t1/scaffold7520.1/size10799/1
MNYTGNIRDAWHALDADGSGKVTLCEFHWGTAEAPFSGNGSCWGLDSWGLEVSGILKQPGILYTIFAISQGGDDVCIATRGML